MRTLAASLATDAEPTHRDRVLVSAGSVEPTGRPRVAVATSRDERAARRAGERKARRALHEALAGIEGACSETGGTKRLRRLWPKLTRGDWSLVEAFEHGGRRYFLFHEDISELGGRGLTRREREVVRHAALGLSNKHIGLSLGISPSTVGSALNNARKKLARRFR